MADAYAAPLLCQKAAEESLKNKAWFVVERDLKKIPADFKFWTNKAQPILARAKEGIKNYKPPVRTVPKTNTTQPKPRTTAYPKQSNPRPKPTNNPQPSRTPPPKKVIECKDGDIFNCR